MFGTGDRITYASGDPAEVWDGGIARARDAEMDNGPYILPVSPFVAHSAGDGGIVRAIDAEFDDGFYILTEGPFVTAMSEVIANKLVGDHGFWVYPHDADMAADLLNESLPS